MVGKCALLHKKYKKLRVSDYRVVFKIEGTIIKILAISHRSNVYAKIKKRIPW